MVWSVLIYPLLALAAYSEWQRPGPALWACNLGSHTGPRSQKSLTHGLMSCRHHLEILKTLNMSPAFSSHVRLQT